MYYMSTFYFVIYSIFLSFSNKQYKCHEQTKTLPITLNFSFVNV